jgi:hypothetical protein
MKKLLVTLSIILSASLYGQEVEIEHSIIVVDTDIMKIEGLHYIELLGTAKLNGDIIVSVDYGQKTKIFGKAQTIRDESKGSFQNGTAKNMTFNSMIDALNWFDARGWDYVNQYAITIGNSNVYHILLKKED